MFNPIRQSDDWGAGFFGASRGSRPHLGVDYVVSEGEVVYSPTDMKITRISYPYATLKEGQSDRLTGIAFSSKIAGVNYDGRIWYFVPDSALIGTDVVKGQRIGLAQSLEDRYDERMTNHIHVQYRTTTPIEEAIYYNGWYYVSPEDLI